MEKMNLDLNKKCYCTVTIWEVNDNEKKNEIIDGGGLGNKTLQEHIETLLNGEYVSKEWLNKYGNLLSSILCGSVTEIEESNDGDIFIIGAPIEGFALQHTELSEDKKVQWSEVVDFNFAFEGNGANCIYANDRTNE